MSVVNCILAAASNLQNSLLPASSQITRVERSLAIQPVFRSSSQKYCLMVFGPTAKTQIWLILDGDLLHVIRADNLQHHTLQLRQRSEWREYSLGDVVELESEIKHRDLKIIFSLDLITLTMRSDGWGLKDLGYVVTNPKFSDHPGEAPIVHFNGPLMIRATLYEKESKIHMLAEIGIQGLGESTFASITPSVAEQVLSLPVTEMTFTGNDGCLHRDRWMLNYDC